MMFYFGKSIIKDMKVPQKIAPKKPILTLGCYSDDWNGCSLLINELIDYNQYWMDKAKKLGDINRMGELIKIEFTDDTKVNPAFYPLIWNYLGFINKTEILSPKWKKLEDFRRLENNIAKVKDSNNTTWTNVNSVYPNYENKGTIVVNRLDTDDVILLSDGSKIGLKDNSVHNWSAQIANFLTMIDKFSNPDFKLKPYEHRAIKYIAGEIIANTFQHAFKNDGASSIGIFLDETKREITMTISDRGLSIPGSVRTHNDEKKHASDIAAIEWALGKGNTTKEKGKQGGMGLYRVKTIIESAEGEFAFRSYKGTYHFKDGKVSKSNNYYANFGTVFYTKIKLDKITRESVEISKDIWEEVKGVFK